MTETLERKVDWQTTAPARSKEPGLNFIHGLDLQRSVLEVEASASQKQPGARIAMCKLRQLYLDQTVSCR